MSYLHLPAHHVIFFFFLLKLLKIPSTSFFFKKKKKKKIEKVTEPIYIHMIVCVVFTLRE
jgi:hypothetical protein